MKRRKSLLERFIDAVVGFTGLDVCVYDFDFFTKDDEKLRVAPSLLQHRSGFCQKIKSCKEGHSRCIRDEYYRAEQAHRKNGPFIHTCHAGITELIVPIRNAGRRIGALYLGQAVTLSLREQGKTTDAVAKSLGYDLGEVRKLYAAQPRLTPRGLRAHADLMNGLRDYVELSERALRPPSTTHSSLEIKTPGPLHSIRQEEIPIQFLNELNPRSQAIANAVGILRSNYWKRIGLPDTAKKVGLSPSHFSREFGREVGMPFRKCLSQTRIDAALYLLKKSHLNIGQIAEMIGYGDVSSMSRAFRRLTGKTAREFIRLQAQVDSRLTFDRSRDEEQS